jgi:RNase P subunit RPR2
VTEPRLTEIRHRLASATPGPWHRGTPLMPRAVLAGESIVAVSTLDNFDADLIANAPEDLAFLLDLVAQHPSEPVPSVKTYASRVEWLERRLVIADATNRELAKRSVLELSLVAHVAWWRQLTRWLRGRCPQCASPSRSLRIYTAHGGLAFVCVSCGAIR